MERVLRKDDVFVEVGSAHGVTVDICRKRGCRLAVGLDMDLKMLRSSRETYYAKWAREQERRQKSLRKRQQHDAERAQAAAGEGAPGVPEKDDGGETRNMFFFGVKMQTQPPKMQAQRRVGK